MQFKIFVWEVIAILAAKISLYPFQGVWKLSPLRTVWESAKKQFSSSQMFIVKCRSVKDLSVASAFRCTTHPLSLVPFSFLFFNNAVCLLTCVLLYFSKSRIRQYKFEILQEAMIKRVVVTDWNPVEQNWSIQNLWCFITTPWT